MGPTAAIVRGALFFAIAHVLTVGGDTFGEGLERAVFAFVVRLPVAFLLLPVLNLLLYTPGRAIGGPDFAVGQA
ncbi:MAG: hypothetical protein C4333_09755, partial [Meiothermus sp.]